MNRANSLTLIPNPYTSLIHALGWGTSEINTPFLTILIIDKCNNGFCAANSVVVSPLTPQASNETPKKSHAEFPRLKFFSVRDQMIQNAIKGISMFVFCYSALYQTDRKFSSFAFLEKNYTQKPPTPPPHPPPPQKKNPFFNQGAKGIPERKGKGNKDPSIIPVT